MKLNECPTFITKRENEKGNLISIRWKREEDVLELVKELKNKIKLFDPEKEDPCLSLSNRAHNQICEQTIKEVFEI